MDNLRDWAPLVVQLVLATGGGLAWLFTFRNRNAEAKRIEAEADATTSGAWKNYADKLEATVLRLEQKVESLEDELEAVKSGQAAMAVENVDLRRRLEAVEAENVALRAENAELRQTIRAGARATLDEIRPENPGEEPNDGR